MAHERPGDKAEVDKDGVLLLCSSSNELERSVPAMGTFLTLEELSLAPFLGR